MRRHLLMAALAITTSASAQNNTAGNIIEGGRVLVELVRVLKIPKSNMIPHAVAERKDSCFVKNICDLCLKNASGKSVIVSLFKRSGNGYEAGVLSCKILPRNQECWYELKAGIYKMKIEKEEGEVFKIYQEGELKLVACSNTFREIKDE